jgi:hypothetical protein
VRCEHAIALAVSEVIVTDIQGWNPLQMRSEYLYSLRKVRSDECVVEVPRDTVMTNHTGQGWNVVG